jgi:hypothetical protein
MPLAEPVDQMHDACADGAGVEAQQAVIRVPQVRAPTLEYLMVYVLETGAAGFSRGRQLDGVRR